MAQQLGYTYSFHEPTSRHTASHVDGPADLFASADSHECLSQMARCANELEVPYLVIENGFNILVSDAGIRGMVIALTRGFDEIMPPQPQ